MNKENHPSILSAVKLIKLINLIKKYSFIFDQVDRLWHLLFVIMLIGIGGICLAACSNNQENSTNKPVIALNPQTGGVQTLVAVTGDNFPAGTAVMLRLGPPDVGATPFSYASGIAGGDGRFTLSFTVPESWPDGLPITETNLTVIVLNEDGSLKATAFFVLQPGVVGQPTPFTVDGVNTPDNLFIANEQAIVNSVTNYLVQIGETTQAAISVEKMEGEFARVSVHFLEANSDHTLIGFLKLVNDVWEVLIIGQDFDSDQLLELGIPPSMLPEEMLTPKG